MPLETFSIREAIRRAGRNSQKAPEPRQGGRPPKTLKLWCEPSFKIVRGASIFTVGSCFARHVEAVLGEFGFALPAFTQPSAALGLIGKDTGALNKYTPASIANELRWAFGDFHGTAIESALVSHQGKFWDGQLHVRMNELIEYDAALTRRLAVNAA